MSLPIPRTARLPTLQRVVRYRPPNTTPAATPQPGVKPKTRHPPKPQRRTPFVDSAAGTPRQPLLLQGFPPVAPPSPALATVLYTDNALVAINKPPGLVAQSTAKGYRKEGTLAEVIDYLQPRLNLEAHEKLHPVHRLDKSTTGVLLLARSKAHAQELSRQFRPREKVENAEISKHYLALVKGDLMERTGREEGVVQASLMKTDDGRVRLYDRKVPNAGPATTCRTEWEMIGHSRLENISLLRLKLVTGFKHQIRAHLAEVLNSPVIGDMLYRPKSMPGAEGAAAIWDPDSQRLFLHAQSISLWRYKKGGQDSGTRYRLEIRSPLPADFVELCEGSGIRLSDEYLEGGPWIDGEKVPYEPPETTATGAAGTEVTEAAGTVEEPQSRREAIGWSRARALKKHWVSQPRTKCGQPIAVHVSVRS